MKDTSSYYIPVFAFDLSECLQCYASYKYIFHASGLYDKPLRENLESQRAYQLEKRVYYTR